MELDFDKEINALLRQATRSGEFVSTNEQNHLDADEISAFAENALPEKTRIFYVKHFADCDRCRTILSNTILLNQEAETEAASSAVAAPVSEIVAPKIPWYRKMFLMPNLAYTMGGLVLVFGGMLGFLVLQNMNQSGSSDVSRVQEKAPSRSSGPNASDEGISYNSAASNANAAMSNNTAMSSNSTSNSAASVSNSAMSNTQTFPPDKSALEPSSPGEVRQQNPAKSTDDALSSANKESRNARENEFSEKNKIAEAQKDEAARATTDSVAAPKPAPPPPPPPSVTMKRTENLPQVQPSENKRDRAVSGAINNARQIGGKTFNRVNGVWIDSAFGGSNGGKTSLSRTKTIRRGSSEYQKLDKQVRIIAESLDGAVIIVWRDGSYRIQ